MDAKLNFSIGNRVVGDGSPCFIIAEIGSNHNQSLDTALEMIRVAADCGVDAVKFQSLNYEECFAESYPEYKTVYEKIKLEESWYPILKAESDKVGLEFFSAPCYLRAVNVLESIDVELYKIASPQTLSFPQVIRKVARTQKPLIISTGYCSDKEIERALNICREERNERFVILHCVSQYPAKPEQINLAAMSRIKERFGCMVGFSDHTLGLAVPLAAAVLGAAVIEKHFTLDRKMEGPDHAFATEPAEFKALVQATREMELSIGSHQKVISEHEQRLGEKVMHYRLVAGCDIPVGESLSNKLEYKRAKKGILATEEAAVLSMKLVRPLTKGEVLEWSDFLRS